MSFAPGLFPDRDDTLAIGRAKGGGTTYYSIPSVHGAGSGTLATVADADYYMPWWTPTPLVIDQLAIQVATVSAGTIARIGFYRVDRDWQPIGAPLADSGNLDTSTTGVKTYTPGTPIFVPRGRYASVLNSDTGTTSFNMTNNPLLGAFHTTIASHVTSLRVTRAYAAFPTPGTAWDTVGTGNGALNHMVFYRILRP